MKVIQVTEDCELKIGNRVIEKFIKDKFYIMSGGNLNRLKCLAPSLIGLEIPFKEIYNEYKGQDLNNKKILMLRHGGGGDILFMATGAVELGRIYPSCTIDFAIGEQYIPLVVGNPIIKKTFSIPILVEEWNSYNYHLIFEGIIESNKQASLYNAYDLFMEKMGLDPKDVDPERKIPRISVTPMEKQRILKAIPMLSGIKKRVGIQTQTSTPIRNYPEFNYIKIAQELIKKGYDIYFFGSLAQESIINTLIKQTGQGAYNIANDDLRMSIVAASFMDFFIAPDSMFVHIAGALGIPVVGIYGPFHSELRMKYFKNVIGIDLDVGCSPCFMHGHHPCPKGDPSPCFSILSPKVVMTAFEKLEEEVGNGNEMSFV